jgi:type II secretion system protein H
MTSTTGRSAERRRGGAGRGPARAGGGFTLLELIVVLVLIGLALGLAAPSLRGFFASRQTADAAAQMLALTQWARSQAAARGTRYRLNIDTEANLYWVTAQEGGEFVDIASEFGRQFRLPEGAVVRVDSPTSDPPLAYVDFYPNGRTDEATIELEGARGDVFQVTCDSATGTFRVLSPAEVQNP